MKSKLAIILLLLTFFRSHIQAEPPVYADPPIYAPPPRGCTSVVGTRQSSNCCSSWPLALGVIGIIATVGGIVAASSTDDPIAFR